MTYKQSIFLILCLMVLLQVALVVPAGAAYVSLSNTYLSTHLGVSGTIKVGETEWPVTGRWAVTSNVGDPEVAIDDGAELVYFGNASPAHLFGAFKIKIGQDVFIIGDTSTGRWSETPKAYPIPRPGLGLGTTGGFIEGVWQVTQTLTATIKIRMSLVRDQARFEFTVTNTNATAQSIGLEMQADVTVDDMANSKGYAFIPGIGAELTEATGTSIISNPYGVFLTGNKVPNSFEIYDNVEQPGIVVRSTLGEQDATRPDHIAIGERGEFLNPAVWLSTNLADPNNWRPSLEDKLDNLCYLMCWAEKRMEPSATRKIVTYYGMGAANAMWTSKYGWNKLRSDSAVLAVQGPKSLGYDSTQSTTAVIKPGTFEIKAYVYNLATDPGGFKLEDVKVFLSLPPGLQLASVNDPDVPDNRPSQTVGNVAINSESAPVTWRVEATGDYCGELTYYVIATAESGWQQIVSRKIMIPATNKSVFKGGWQLMSVPFGFNNPLIDHVLSPNNLTLGDFRALYYHPIEAPDYTNVTQVTPGRGFWMLIHNLAYGQNMPFFVADDYAIVSEVGGKQGAEYTIPLERGWNMVGNPYVYPVYWGQVQVKNRDLNITLSLDEAVRNGWINKTLWAWNSDRLTYENYKTNDAMLAPWRGYWVYAKEPSALVFQPAVFPGTSVTTFPGGF